MAIADGRRIDQAKQPLRLPGGHRFVVPIAFLLGSASYVAALFISIAYENFPTGALTVTLQTGILLLAIVLAKILQRND